MGTIITGPDPSQSVWPVVQRATTSVTKPTGDATTGGSYPAVLGDNNDTTYQQEKTANNYYRVNVAALALPANSRITMVSAAARARLHSGNTLYRDFLVAIGDHSKANSAATDVPGSPVHGSLGSTFRTFYSASKYLTSQGKLFTQNDINKGVYVLAGLNTVYGTKPSANGADISDLWIRYAYDMPPNATITSPTPSQTISNTSTPIITWDYSDDFQPQAKYQVQIFNGTTLVYDSGLVTSSDTFHVVGANLPNATYTANVTVYQKWALPVGGDFPDPTPATVTFTIALTSLGTPRITATPSNEHVVLSIYPDVNLLSYDTSTMDNGPIGWLASYGNNVTIASSAAPVRDGNLSLKITLSSTTSPAVATATNEVTVTPNATMKGYVYLNPLGLSGRTATFNIKWYTSANALISTSSGSATALATNTWTQVGASGLVVPNNAAYAQIQITFAGTTAVNDVFYMDDAFLIYQVDTAALPTWSRGGFFENTKNLISYSDSTIEDTGFTWTPDAASLVAQTTAKAFHATASLNLTKAATGVTGTIQANLGSVNSAIPVTPGQVITCYGWANCDGPLTPSNGMSWYKSDLTPSATASSQGGSVAVIAGAWTLIAGNVTAPSDAAYGVPYIRVAGASAGNQYWDAMAWYTSDGVTRFWRGYYPNTDVAPTLLIEYTDDGVHWKTLLNELIFGTGGQDINTDYTIPSNVSGQSRTYRASLTELENGQQLYSPYSATANTSVMLSHVWLHQDMDPPDTSYNFQFDGAGRSESLDAKAVNVEIEGLEFGFAQFGIQSLDSLDVQLHCDTLNDTAAIYSMAQAKDLIVFRDQRGRVIRGTMGTVRITDFQPGVGADVSFTIQASGVQP